MLVGEHRRQREQGRRHPVRRRDLVAVVLSRATAIAAVSYEEASQRRASGERILAAFASGSAEEATYEAVHALGGDSAAEGRAVALISGR